MTTAPTGTAFEVRTSDGLRLHATDHGGDGPVVLLVHGFPDTSALWDPVLPHLAGVRVVTYDVRGAGRSEKPASRRGYALTQLARDVLAVADAASPDEPVHLVGHDWGALQGFEVACTPEYRDRIATFTSFCGTSLDHAGLQLRAITSGDDPVLEAAGKALRQTLRSWYVFAFQAPVLPEVLIRTGLARKVLPLVRPPAPDETPATFTSDAMHGVDLYRANLGRVFRPQRSTVHVPVQMVMGTRDPFVTPVLAEQLEEHASPCWVRTIDGAHWLPRSQPVEVAASIMDLVEHDRGGATSPAFDAARR